MVFEVMNCSLREGLKRWSKPGRGVSLGIAHSWSKQFLTGLRHMHRYLINTEIRLEKINYDRIVS